MKLVIVESPHKSETIGHFLGSDFKVLASKGHIRDLATSGKMGLGVDVEDGFKATYTVDKTKNNIIKELKSYVNKADVVYLATDPDREGEAISWHLAKVLGLDIETTPRLEFHEITKGAILKAIENPRTIDMNLVESQETRRIIDRLMGFRLSTLLQRKIKSRSAGRVQSVVLKFIVDKEKQILAFVPEEYWNIDGTFNYKDGETIKAQLKNYKKKPLTIHNEEEADKIISSFSDSFVISSIKKEIKSKKANDPFITSTLQQEAYSQCHFSIKKTASIAQVLYEGKEINGQMTGLITYMRTDSTRLSDEFIYAAKDYISEVYGKEYLGNVHVKKASKNVQDAHEAIRPTDITITPKKASAFLTKDELSLYTLIYDRAIASLMNEMKYQVKTITISNGDYDFITSTNDVIFKGYTAIYGKYEEKEEKNKIPEDLTEGAILTLGAMEKSQHFTKAPNRYNEGKIVHLMQENGIGRPSTYAATVSTIIDREYVEKSKGSLVPTKQGTITVEQLEEYFPKYMDASYTAGMEDSLDEIALGNMDRVSLLSSFWDEFKKYYEAAESNMEKVKEPLEIIDGEFCPDCGAPLCKRKGRYGEFLGCSNFPKCHYIKKETNEEVKDRVCPHCGGKLIYRNSKKGKFIGCSNYPKCRYMEDMDGNEIGKKEVEIPSDAPLCPKCQKGHLIERTSRWGNKFIGCSNYPKCKYRVLDKEKPE